MIWYENDIPDNVADPESVNTDISDNNGNVELIEAINSLTESLNQQHADYEEQKENEAQTEEEVVEEEPVVNEEEIQAEKEAQEQKEIEMQEWRENITNELADLKAGLSMFMMIYLIFAIWKHISNWRMKATGRL